jgi:hypothetical protein
MDPVSRAQAADNSGNAEKRRLANLRPWKAGQTGNANGRPKKLRITKLFEQMLAKPGKRKKIQKVVEDILEKRGMASVLLLREMTERTEGKVSQEIELNGNLTTLSDAELAEKLAKLTKK